MTDSSNTLPLRNERVLEGDEVQIGPVLAGEDLLGAGDAAP